MTAWPESFIGSPYYVSCILLVAAPATKAKRITAAPDNTGGPVHEDENQRRRFLNIKLITIGFGYQSLLAALDSESLLSSAGDRTRGWIKRLVRLFGLDQI